MASDSLRAAGRITQPQEPSDEELMSALAAGRHEALEQLYCRYWSVVLNMAARTLERAAAEEIAQDVFLSVWRHATLFTAERGAFRSWIQQIARNQILNELRRRGRRPQLEADPEGLLLANLPDRDPNAEEMACRAPLRQVMQSALTELSPPQSEALGLVLFQDLTHAQVAMELGIPLGTAKTRIRAGLRKLRCRLSPVMAGSAPDWDSHFPRYSLRVTASRGLRPARHSVGWATRSSERVR